MECLPAVPDAKPEIYRSIEIKIEANMYLVLQNYGDLEH